ncbi:S-layer family protein [Nostoc sp. PCC 7107]|uniref:two-partner secretion domain-containing protein n=1 Tax=Nostoc sp. PCC 7107 TaxID=317936 RepID=UPI00029EE6C6|nr:S-layer family protein [Nostoc sp. PCC 7107]AFY45259.1 filamentous hemagglutinin family outer membrane protein [Nostoc sp. PCC 7107]
MKLTFTGLGFIGAIFVSAIYNSSVHAQVIPDHTLNTSVLQNGNNFTITDGNRVGNNLFHSFSQFSVPSNGSASFNNSTDIQNIFSRVTGGSVSNIDGNISAKGSANLFLLNPAGIIFRQNASLNIGGSFIATTANSIKFADGIEFSATNITSPALLTMSVPVGLQLGSNPGAITVQGAGHNGSFSASSSISGLNVGTRGLQLQSGKTLALVGGNIALDGGLLSAPGGQIELGSVSNVSVSLNSTSQGFTLSYPSTANFGNITLTQRALASTRDLSRGNGGSVNIQGKQVSIRDGSLVLVQNRSNQAAGDIVINATESLDVIGKSPDFTSSSSLINDTMSSEAAGNVIITTPKLNVDQGGYILNRTFSAAAGGNIVVNSDAININGFALGDPTPFRAVSQILAASFGRGQGGNISLSTQDLSISAGANIAARPYSSGKGGDVNVKADTIQVIGTGTPKGSYFSLLSAATFGPGDAGNLNIDTRKLSVQGGGRVSASSIILGNAGSLTINASESIDVSGMKPEETPSYIGTAALPVGSFSTISRANAGNTNINAPLVTVSDGATIFVQNTGLGTAGNLQINANTLTLKNGGNLLASTKAGEGGNINLQLRDLLLMRYGGFISAEAAGSGNGGNISINAPVIVGLENSDIIANAVQGKGGNISITTQGIIGLKFRDTLTPRVDLTNDITASSAFNVNGTVEINNIGVDPNSGLVELPANVSDPSQKIASGCSANLSSSFVATGRGGIPQNPTQDLRSDRTWSDIRDISAFQETQPVKAQTPKSPETLVQATSWHRNPQGKIELIADKSPSQMQPSLTCAAVPKN